jgi:hypothetical protein
MQAILDSRITGIVCMRNGGGERGKITGTPIAYDTVMRGASA